MQLWSKHGRVHYSTDPKFGESLRFYWFWIKKGAKFKVMAFQSVVSVQLCCRHVPLGDSESQRGDCESSLHDAVRMKPGLYFETVNAEIHKL